MKTVNRISKALDDYRKETCNFNNASITIVINSLLFDELVKEDIGRKYIQIKSRWRMQGGSFLKAMGEAIRENIYHFNGVRLSPTDKILPNEFIIID
jgi:hypothetical protein